MTLEGIAVHSFQPALLPPVTPRDALATSGVPAAEAIANDPSWDVDLRLRDPLPPATFANAPLAARVTSDLPFLGAEVGASWYRGRSPIPEVAASDLDVDFAGRTGDRVLPNGHCRRHFRLHYLCRGVCRGPRGRQVHLKNFRLFLAAGPQNLHHRVESSAAGLDRFSGHPS